MRMALQRWLDSPRSITFASLTTLAIGLFFVFVWAPHPWSWRGIDQYDELARALARGEPFGTTDVPWGYAYFVAVFYRLFPEQPVGGGHRAGVHQRAGAVAVYSAWPGRRLASASRRSPRGSRRSSRSTPFTPRRRRRTRSARCCSWPRCSVSCTRTRPRRTWAFVAAGALSGLVPQFRPNMILLPVLVIAGYVFWPRRLASPRRTRARSRRRIMQCAIFTLAMIAMLMPWIIRNYRYTGTIQPTSTHSGVQLWYGTLQVGPYLESRAHNPRSIFASAAFDYTSLETPLVISADRTTVVAGTSPRLAYRTDRDPALKWVEGSARCRASATRSRSRRSRRRPRSITSLSPAASPFPSAAIASRSSISCRPIILATSIGTMNCSICSTSAG